ncbi:extended synaptotagmin-3-like [Protopterus annectens]|uniref:extended synaptotagmin-3-like n=1 Tax=Protopterus annectens TaxID=7888 RepID=UPI001CFAE36B|nr:extended synaptotagmin-3-like [Protopterus annectens]
MKTSSDSGKNERRDSVFVFEDEQPGGCSDTVGKLNTNAVNQFLVELMFFFGKAFFYLFPVYLAGFFGLSISWILLGLFFWMWWKKNRTGKLARLSSAFEVLEREKYIIAKEIYDHMPAWINFPDIERVEWLNKILQQAWPFFGSYMDKLLKDTIEPSIRGYSMHLKTFTFTKIDFGEKCFRINGVKTYTKEVDKRQVILDLQIR